METTREFDVLLIEAVDAIRRRWEKALRAEINCRASSHSSARSALTSYVRTRFDAIVCGTEFSDTDCWRFLSMVRSGRFGFPETPVFVICEPDELDSLAPMVDSQTSLVEFQSPRGIAHAIARRARDHTKSSVLIVEDEPEAASAAQRALEKHYDAEVVYDGTEGLGAWRARRHDLVLLDLMLPGMTGAEVLVEILRLNPDQPVMILTAHDAAERQTDLMLSGARRYFAKPFDMSHLASECASVLRDAACLKRAADARERGLEFSARIQAADYTLRAGRTAEASHHLLHALQACRTQGISDDHWAAIMTEFPANRKPPE
jgi:DNA-binding response OmpR family regulator